MTAMHDMKYRQVGFTLVEMMVAMLLGIVILMAVSEVFVNNNRTRVEIENTTRQIENGRYAMQLLEGELANAGFFGESSGVVFPADFPPACVKTSAEVEDSLGVPVYGGATVFSSGTDCRGANVQAESDYLAIRRSSTCAVDSTGCDVISGAYHLQVAACQSTNSGDPIPGAIILSATSDGAPDTAKARNCSDPAPTYRYLNRLYYVDNDNVLRRAELGSGAYESTPLVDGIERLHFAYGLDDDDDGEVDRFLEASAIDALGGDSWGDVVAVRVWLLARNLERTPGYTDGRTYVLGGDAEEYTPSDDFKRQLYTSTVRLNNIAGRRESPAAETTGGETAQSSSNETSSDATADPAS